MGALECGAIQQQEGMTWYVSLQVSGKVGGLDWVY
jgi:hypothetical protein